MKLIFEMYTQVDYYESGYMGKRYVRIEWADNLCADKIGVASRITSGLGYMVAVDGVRRKQMNQNIGWVMALPR